MAEMFQLGVHCLGESNIAALLSTAEIDTTAVPSPASTAESTLFVPDHGSSTKKGKAKRKRVSFAGPNMLSLFPEFLFHASGYLQRPIPAVPELPHDKAKQFEMEIGGLGNQHIADLQRLEKEDKDWWTRKQTQLAHTFMQD